MIDIKELPKDPMDAIQVALRVVISDCRTVSGALSDLKAQNHPIFNSIIVASAVCRGAAKRVDDLEIRELIERTCQIDETASTKNMGNRFEAALAAVAAYQLDLHFIDEEDDKTFDQAALSPDEKSDIRALMARARKLVDLSEEMKEWQRRKVLYHISKIENELHKEMSSFQTFVAAAGEISGLVKKLGHDAQPIAEAVQKARTITERKLEGTLLLEKEEQPKQITKAKE